MHHFLALRPDGATRDRLAAISDRLRAWELPATWTHPDDLHLTVAFLGHLDDDEAALIPAAIDDVARSIRRPSLQLAGLGASGSRGAGLQTVPRAVFAAVADPAGICTDVHRDLAECLEQRPDATYRPHVTLCRPLPHAPAGQLFRDWPHLLEAHGLADWGPCTIEALVLYRATERRPRYEELTRWQV